MTALTFHTDFLDCPAEYGGPQVVDWSLDINPEGYSRVTIGPDGAFGYSPVHGLLPIHVHPTRIAATFS